MKRHVTSLIALVALTAIALTACTNNSPQETGNHGTVEQKAGSPSAVESEMERAGAVQQVIDGTFAIQNVNTGKNLRPYNAGTSDENRIVLYPHNEWKCMTWRFLYVENNVYQLQNLYTGKTLTPSATTQKGVTLWQQPLNDSDSLQYWKFIEQSDEAYLINLKDTDLYITISSDETDSPIILMPLQDSNGSTGQLWKLFEQDPPF